MVKVFRYKKKFYQEGFLTIYIAWTYHKKHFSQTPLFLVCDVFSWNFFVKDYLVYTVVQTIDFLPHMNLNIII